MCADQDVLKSGVPVLLKRRDGIRTDERGDHYPAERVCEIEFAAQCDCRGDGKRLAHDGCNGNGQGDAWSCVGLTTVIAANDMAHSTGLGTVVG